VIPENVKKTYEEIKALKIQGARNVAEAAVAAIYTLLFEEKSKNILMKEIKDSVKLLASSRPTEPALRAAMAFVLRKMMEHSDLPDEIFREALKNDLEKFGQQMDEIKERIGEIGSQIIEDGYTIITHCHSSTLMEVFRRAAQDKDFTVVVTETRPRYQGKLTARDLLEAGVKVVYVVDSAAHYYMKKADLYMTGADVVTADARIINKIGTALIALSAKHYGVPYYVAVSSLRFDPTTILGRREVIEERDPSEVIDPKELPGAEIKNPAFDTVTPDLITGIISELGVYSPYVFVSMLSQDQRINPDLERLLSFLNLG
jgi:ribose 1,5-bisphosphate isomerase